MCESKAYSYYGRVRHRLCSVLQGVINRFGKQYQKISRYHAEATRILYDNFQLIRDQIFFWYESLVETACEFCCRDIGPLFWKNHGLGELSGMVEAIDKSIAHYSAENRYVK